MISVKYGTESNLSRVDQKRFLAYLSRVVLSKTNAKVKSKLNELKATQAKYSGMKEELNNHKKDLIVASNDKDKLTMVFTILSIIDTLRIEGKISTKDKVKIIELIPKLEQKNYTELRALYNNLKISLPKQNLHNSSNNNVVFT